MISKPIILFQQGNTFSTPWDDAVNTWNTDSDHHGYWTTAADAQSYLFQFKKQENKVLLKKNEGYIKDGDGYDFVMTRPFVKADSALNDHVSQGVNLHYALEWLDTHPKRSIGYGTPITDGVDLVKNSVFYSRDPWMGGHVFNTMTLEKLTTDESPELQIVTWFYIYRLEHLPIYVVITNPTMLNLAHDLEHETERFRFRFMDSHMMDMGTQFLKPVMSKNAFPLEDKWYVVKGEEFEFDVGALSLPRLVYGEDYPPETIKVHSDLEITYLEGNKYRARFKKGQQSSYLSFRMNTGNTMDWTFINSGNRLVYNIKISKHYEEE